VLLSSPPSPQHKLASRRQLVLWPLAAGLGTGLGAGVSGCAAAALPTGSAHAPSLKQAFGNLMPFGSAVTPQQLRGPEAAFIAHHFNVLVAENAMKPEALAPTQEGQYDFTAADELVDFALLHGMKVRGHTLMWHRQMPPWFFKDGNATVSREVLVARIERYIADVVGHFKGRVHAWDVLNEAITVDEPDAQADAQGLRIGELYKIIGPEYIDIAFRAAAKADPDALLFYNDYETQAPKKVALISRLVQGLKARGVKIDGIGHQAHCSAGHPSVADFERAIDAYAQLGVTQHVTELDIALNRSLMDNEVSAATPELLQRQAQRYDELVSLFLSKRAQVTALLVWGIGDAHTWLTSWPVERFEAPLLFDTALRPKPAYHAVMEAARRAG
jgi:endo-1,4-beta-xylanase